MRCEPSGPSTRELRSVVTLWAAVRGPSCPLSLSCVPTALLGAQVSALRDPAVALCLTELTNEAIRFRFVIISESSST